MSPLTAISDACVLYPAPLRDLLLRLALTDLFRARWTADIHDEWIRKVLAHRPDLTHAQLLRTRQLMDAHVRDSLVEGYQALIPQLHLPDPKDRHVLAAAMRAQARVIVTFNWRDFPPETLIPYGVEAQPPDPFIAQWLGVAPAQVCAAAEAQRRSLHNPPKSVDAFLAIMLRQG